MMDPNLERSIFELYKDEIYIHNHDQFNTMLKAFIFYKHRIPVDSYIFEGEPFRFIYPTNEEDVPTVENIKNCILIGGKPIFEQNYVNEMISAFINSSMNDDSEKYKIYIMEEKRVVHIVRGEEYGYRVFNNSIEKVLCAILQKLMPWYFGNITSELQSEISPLFINKDNPNKFNEKFEELINELGIIEKIQLDKLAKMADKLVERKTRIIEDNVQQMRNEVNGLFARIFDLNKNIKEKSATLFAIKYQGEELKTPVEEIMEFIKYTNENIKIRDVQDESIVFDIVTTLDQFTTEEDYEGIIKNNNGNSFAFTNINEECRGYDVEIIKEFYHRLMVEKEFAVQTSCTIYLNVLDGRVDAEGLEAPNSIQQPHLERHNCFGTARETIAQFTMDNRFVEALNQIMYSVKQLSLNDGAVAPLFTERMSNAECIKLKDGTFTTMKNILREIANEMEKKGE